MENSFLKKSSIFRSDVGNGKYIPILDNLHHIASTHHNNLPTNFSIDNIFYFSEDDVKYVLSSLYPERRYCCSKVKNIVFCVREY